jgi:hypothetical protein
MKTPIYTGTLQSDLDFAGFSPVNLPGWPPTGGGGGGDANTVTASDIGLVGDGVTDNTAALQAWLNSVGTAKVNSTLLVPDGVYVFSGALQDGSGANAQIVFPSVGQADPAYSVTIKGYHPLLLIPWPNVSMPLPRGPIFKSTLNTGSGTQPAFMGGRGPIGVTGTPYLSFMSICFENMIFQMPSNPVLTCLNLSHYSVVQILGNNLITAGTSMGSGDAVNPTTTTSYGLILPPDSESILQHIDSLNIWNFYTGLKVGECTNTNNLFIGVCHYSAEFAFANHSSIIKYFQDWHCPYGIHVTGTHAFRIELHDIELAPTGDGWSESVQNITDAGNNATADITWWTVKGNVGPVNTYVLNGGANIQARRVGSASGGDLRWVQLSGGGKLQARNTGTNTWADVDQWTNP